MIVTNLRSYLAEVGMSMKEFSQLVDCHHTYLAQIAKGTKTAGRRLARDIEKATDGIIKLKTRPRSRKIPKDFGQKTL